MGNQDERLGSLLFFNDFALILSTYGVLLLFNYLFEPINSNTWIVCTFFVGIKILIVGIADITGIGRNYIVSFLFTLIADGIIILINQLMAFGLSLRLMLIMVVADLIFVFIAVFIWKKFRADNISKTSQKSEWVYSDETNNTPEKETIKTEINQSETEYQPQKALAGNVEGVIIDESVPEETENIFNFESLNNSESNIQENLKLFDEFQEEPTIEGQEIVNFEELTQELPSQEELNKVLEETEQESPETIEESTIDSSFNYFEGLDFFNDFIQPSSKEEIEKSEENLELEEESEENNLEIETTQLTESEEIEEPEIELEEEAETEATISEPEISEESDLLSNVLNESEEITEEVTESSDNKRAFFIPEGLSFTEKNEPEEISVEEEIPVEEEIEEKPLFIDSVYQFNVLSNSTIGLKPFSNIPVNLNQEKLDEIKSETKEEINRFNTNLGKVVEKYNESLGETAQAKKIDNFIQIEDTTDLSEAEQILRDNLQMVDNQGFFAPQVIRTLRENINKLNNRTYSINLAEDNLNERLRREQQLLEDRQRRQAQLEQQRELERQEQENKLNRERLEKEHLKQLEKQKITQEEVVSNKSESEEQSDESLNNEVFLQSDDMDIIIDAADLELLKEFLAQQETNI